MVALQHVGATYLCIYTFGGGYLGAAWATVWSNLLATALVAGYVCAAGLQDRVWGRPSRAALSGWLPYARLAYSSAAMKVRRAALALHMLCCVLGLLQLLCRQACWVSSEGGGGRA